MLYPNTVQPVLKIPLLKLANQNKAFFIVLTNQNKVLCIKINEFQNISVKVCFKDSCKAQCLQEHSTNKQEIWQ